MFAAPLLGVPPYISFLDLDWLGPFVGANGKALSKASVNGIISVAAQSTRQTQGFCVYNVSLLLSGSRCQWLQVNFMLEDKPAAWEEFFGVILGWRWSHMACN